MPPSRTVAPYSPPRTPIGAETVAGPGRHLPPFIPVTNSIENLNRQIRKTIKTRGHFPDEQAATKLIYLAILRAEGAWKKPYNWTGALRGLKIHFGDRLPD
jgi:transposase-like protein